LLQAAAVIGHDVPFALLQALAEQTDPDLRLGPSFQAIGTLQHDFARDAAHVHLELQTLDRRSTRVPVHAMDGGGTGGA
jgi:hypothetical protein